MAGQRESKGQEKKEALIQYLPCRQNRDDFRCLRGINVQVSGRVAEASRESILPVWVRKNTANSSSIISMPSKLERHAMA